MNCFKCHKSSPEVDFYKGDKYCCIECRKEYQKRYYHGRYGSSKRVGKGGGSAERYTKEDEAKDRAWNEKHPYVFTSCKAFIEHKIFTGVITI